MEDRLEEDNERLEITPLNFLEALYRNPDLPLPTRMRAAIEAAPYKHAKRSVMAVAHYGPNFADELDRAIARSKQQPMQLNPPKVIEHEYVNCGKLVMSHFDSGCVRSPLLCCALEHS